MNSIGVVVLNYLNYEDTIECVNSLLDQQTELCKIIVVDNGSYNESCRILAAQYAGNDMVEVIRTKRNLGFARGNNVGIQYLRKHYHAKFVYVVNNDVIFEDKNYFNILLKNYCPGVGMIGSRIRLKNGKAQIPPQYYVDFRNALITYLHALCTWWRCLLWKQLLPAADTSKRIEVLHGCGLLFTPDFFKYYSGFYPRTFLYCEEPILYIMCRIKELTQKYVDDTYIFHKEDQSSEMSFHNDNKVMAGYNLKSQKFLVWWSMKLNIKERL